MKSTGMFEFLGKLSAVWYVIINKSGKKNATHAILFNHILKITWQEPDFCHALYKLSVLFLSYINYVLKILFMLLSRQYKHAFCLTGPSQWSILFRGLDMHIFGFIISGLTLAYFRDIFGLFYIHLSSNLAHYRPILSCIRPL